MPVEIIILAAGKGTRMYSALPKVLHDIGGTPLLGHVIRCAHDVSADKLHVIYGHGGDMVPDRFRDDSLINWVLQAEQLGTGHAVQQAMPHVSDSSTVLILYGDVPLIRPETLQQLLDGVSDTSMSLLTAVLDDGASYGRIVRGSGNEVQRIVEKKDAKPEELKICEINTGFMAARASDLRKWLAQLKNDNAQGEYYLTDVIALAVADNKTIHTAHPEDEMEIMGINNKRELALMEREYQRRRADALMEQGVTLRDPSRFDVRGELTVGQDVIIDVNVVIEGKVHLGDNVTIGPNTCLRDAEIGAGTVVLANSVIDEATIGEACRIGPFARIRPETRIANHAHVGNFVEIKKSDVGDGSKINHLSYVGDTTIGSKVNIGAGTITCNYDGANKHRTIIEDGAFIGSDSQLVAPVTIGKGATIGAGSTITRDAPDETLTLSRSKQKSIDGWQRPKKNK